MFVVVLIAVILLSDASDKLDKHPIPPSTYLTLGLGALCASAALVAWLLEKFRDRTPASSTKDPL